MELQTTTFGTIEYHEEDIITFPKGLLGFEAHQRYVLFALDQQERPVFYRLHALDEDLSFYLLDPFVFFPAYDIQLEESVVQALEIEQPDDALVFTMITSQGNLQVATTNLAAPIVINQQKKIAKQVVLDSGRYMVKQPLFAKGEEESKQEGEK